MDNYVFISYARADGEDFARRLYTDLLSMKINIWIDVHNIHPGQDWDDEIDKALHSACAVIIVLTPGSQLSLQVKSEWNDALNRNLPIIPLLVKECRIPRVLTVFNWIDFRDDYGVGITSLTSRLQNLSQDHLLYLQQRLRDFELAAKNVDEAANFERGIVKLKAVISDWQQLTPPVASSEAPDTPRDSSAQKRSHQSGLNLVGFRQLLIHGKRISK